MRQKAAALARYLAGISAIVIGLFALIELGGWIIHPSRYKEPPAVTEEVWLESDALTPGDIPWMKEFVDEFCRSYRAEWKSYVYYRRYPFSGKLINVDSAGIRRTVQYALHDTAGARPRRIFLFGGSTMWGTGARDSGTIPSALAQIIAADTEFGPAEVINMGETGYVSTQELIRLELELRRGNIPDIVLLYDGGNDTYGAYLDGEAGLPQNEIHRVTEFNLLKNRWQMIKLGLEGYLERTVTAGMLSGLRSLFWPTQPQLPEHLELADGVVKMYRGNLEILEALSIQYGFRYEAFWQPVVFVRPDPSPYERKQSEQQRMVRPLFLDVYRRIAHDPPLGANPHFHDISGLFDRAGMPVYIDFLHVSEAGNRIVARRMYEKIRNPIHDARPSRRTEKRAMAHQSAF